jgi:hypothetical protein
MKERPILFSGEMVRAILEGRKTQTRRVLKKQPEKSTWEGLDGYRFDVRFFDDVICGTTRKHSCGVRFANRLHQREDCALWVPCPYGQPGDRLWVKEKHRLFCHSFEFVGIEYASGGADKLEHFEDRTLMPSLREIAQNNKDGSRRWKPSIFMRRWASRITLEIVSVRVERLQDITEEDAKAEGVEPYNARLHVSGRGILQNSYVSEYAMLWNDINGKGSWDANPWVWVVEFKKVEVAK